jgi:hypothetical protein
MTAGLRALRPAYSNRRLNHAGEVTVAPRSKRKPAPSAAQATPQIHPAIRIAGEITEVAERIQELVGEIGKDFTTLAKLVESLPKSCNDLRHQTLNQHRLLHALQQECARAGLAPVATQNSNLHGMPHFDEFVRHAACGIHARF